MTEGTMPSRPAPEAAPAEFATAPAPENVPAAEIFRFMTTRGERTFEGTLVSQENGVTTIQLTDGRTVRVSVEIQEGEFANTTHLRVEDVTPQAPESSPQ